jgi:hypothetical protein
MVSEAVGGTTTPLHARPSGRLPPARAPTSRCWSSSRHTYAGGMASSPGWPQPAHAAAAGWAAQSAAAPPPPPRLCARIFAPGPWSVSGQRPAGGGGGGRPGAAEGLPSALPLGEPRGSPCSCGGSTPHAPHSSASAPKAALKSHDLSSSSALGVLTLLPPPRLPSVLASALPLPVPALCAAAPPTSASPRGVGGDGPAAGGRCTAARR